jgi:hypothetical protein
MYSGSKCALRVSICLGAADSGCEGALLRGSRGTGSGLRSALTEHRLEAVGEYAGFGSVERRFQQHVHERRTEDSQEQGSTPTKERDKTQPIPTSRLSTEQFLSLTNDPFRSRSRFLWLALFRARLCSSG